MKKVAILVIGATHHPLYVHYVRNYWSSLIAYTNARISHIDIFLLFEHRTDLSEYQYLWDNIIQDPNPDLSLLCSRRYHNNVIPGILSKTIYAFELLQDKYDIFFRTNLSSVIKLSALDNFVQNKETICYSGGFVWRDLLRQNLVDRNWVGPEKSIKALSELDGYVGNTFFSGCGYLVSAREIASLVAQKGKIRYDIVDDVSVGLMFSEYEVLRNFSMLVKPDIPVQDMITRIEKSKAPHVRLQHFPVQVAEEFWSEFIVSDAWR